MIKTVKYWSCDILLGLRTFYIMVQEQLQFITTIDIPLFEGGNAKACNGMYIEASPILVETSFESKSLVITSKVFTVGIDDVTRGGE